MVRSKLLIISIASFILLAGCGGNQGADHDGKNLAVGEQHHLRNGDIQELTASIEELPSFLEGKDENLRAIYLAAAKNADLLQWIPCYCGCAESANHQHSGNCFFKEIREDGSVVWDDHGTRCNTCLEIAVNSILMKNDGMSALEIRKWVDETYQEGYAKPTPTPMPQS
jgi:hypothetical protein